ncbi:MAG: RNA methyltransferase [Actinomycetes bacterium]|jgi:23S rRNA (guanosine2251-2'-O)-methyltransferase|nr:MAG: 23S rRNA (guanosine(2251)-2'-O)-methyltransferase RlmB [Actinomycetota bacterium]
MAPAGYGASVEGVHAVAAAAAAGRIEHLWVERGRDRRPDVAAILGLVPRGAVTVVDDVRSMAETTAPQGVVARCRPILPLDLNAFRERTDAVMVLDHVEDPHNLGAVARSVAAAGLGGLVVPARRSAPLSAAAFKAAAGALERVPVALVSSIPDAIARLKDLGMWAVGLSAVAGQSLFGLDLLTEPVAMVVGAEGSGLSRLTAERCDVLVSIPMSAETESLNASVAAALAAYEVMRVRAAGRT